MPDREELMYEVAGALLSSRAASELQEAADQGHATPEAASSHHANVADMLHALLAQLQTLRDFHLKQL